MTAANIDSAWMGFPAEREMSVVLKRTVAVGNDADVALVRPRAPWLDAAPSFSPVDAIVTERALARCSSECSRWSTPKIGNWNVRRASAVAPDQS